VLVWQNNVGLAQVSTSGKHAASQAGTRADARSTNAGSGA